MDDGGLFFVTSGIVTLLARFEIVLCVKLPENDDVLACVGRFPFAVESVSDAWCSSLYPFDAVPIWFPEFFLTIRSKLDGASCRDTRRGPSRRM